MVQWHNIGALNRDEILPIVFETGLALFPDRKIGRIAPGYEADFLFLDRDPRQDLSALEAIRPRVKAGKILDLSALPSSTSE